MKELSIEEKAKRYDKALKRAKNTIEVNQTIPNIVECVESLFPELAESEDEKIRKALINQFSDYKRRGENHGFGYSNDKILDWLERQGKQRSIKEHDICDICDEKASCVIPCPMKLVEQKPTEWSEEDEKM